MVQDEAAATPRVDELTPPERTLLGPGPSNVHPRVLRAMATPMLGYLDPSFVEIMDEVQEQLRYLFRTSNELTFPVSGTGTAAMETAFANLVEPGETVLVPGNGYFGDRMGQVAARAGGEVVTVDAPWGEPLRPADVAAAFDQHDPTVFGVVHGETSTGVRQPAIDELAAIAHGHDAYVVVDTVASLGGVEFRTDAWDVDVAYAGSQKCLSAPPGASPITFDDRALAKIRDRDTQPTSWYLDATLVEEYWGDDPQYHHTAPISLVYALREALRLVAEEGLEERWARHRRVAGAMTEGLEAMGLALAPEPDYWLPTLNAIRVPDDVDDGAVADHLLAEHSIEIVGGLGALAGDIWRIGCMGHSARAANVPQLLVAMGDAVDRHGGDVDLEAGVAAASRALQR
jgi:alanine-glyoxylate transaminase/serine-glyoxylate transaminase/serine-pyruvate transaminase